MPVASPKYGTLTHSDIITNRDAKTLPKELKSGQVGRVGQIQGRFKTKSALTFSKLAQL